MFMNIFPYLGMIWKMMQIPATGRKQKHPCLQAAKCFSKRDHQLMGQLQNPNTFSNHYVLTI